jgi:hypothetical protein
MHSSRPRSQWKLQWKPCSQCFASLPEKLEYHAKIAAGHLANLQAIKTALDPLYASFSDEQKKAHGRLRIGARNVTLMPRRRNRRATGAAIPSPLP